MHNGKITLVGAGPGDRGLLTLRGLEALQGAEVVVYDRLVSDDILALIPAGAEKINVGKASSHHLVRQPDINRILVEKAKEGKNVVRLKGGDPFVFGRGGEELELPAEEGIPFEVVPGITSAVAAFAYAGIPVTHRDYCSSFHVITGHAREGGELSIDFDALVRLHGTLIFLMGVASLGKLMQGLLDAGMEPSMPAAVVENGTRTNQRKVIATVSTLESAASAADIHSPAIIAVGKVCALSDRFDWFDSRPLHGKRILVTRSDSSPAKLAPALQQLGADVLDLPVIRTEPLGEPLPPKSLDVSWITFSSKFGVRCFFDALCRSRLDARALHGIHIAAVGSVTAEELRRYGIIADLIPETFDGEHLAQALIDRTDPYDRILVCEAKIAKGSLMKKLGEAMRIPVRLPLYDTIPLPLRDPETVRRILLEERPLITFTSASMAESFAASLPDMDFTGFHALCIGEKTAAAALSLGFETAVPPEATIDSMAQYISAHPAY